MYWNADMKQKGFSLIELVVIMAIMSILLTIGTLNFKSWNDKAAVESQVNSLYSDLSSVRQKALYEKNGGYSVRISAAGFSVYRPVVATGDTVTAPLIRTSVKVPITTDPGGLQIDFDQSGVATINGDQANLKAAVCIDPKGSGAVYDSLLLSRTRIQIGKLTTAGCSSDNINPQ
jgi:prepilin-type N-terminal cleavage/methylation domain-containing protein